MFGNLSKSLIKVPNHFNLNTENEQKNISKKEFEKILNNYNNLKKINFYKSNKNSHYFKERDFIKNNLHLDLNYNNNFRKNLTPHIKPRNALNFEEFFFGSGFSNTNTNTNTKTNIKTNTNINRNTNILNNNFPFNTNKGTKYSSKSKDFLSSKNSIYSRDSNNILKSVEKLDNEEFNENLNTNIDKLIKKIHENSLNFNLFKEKRGFGGTTRFKRIEILKEFINRDQVVIPPPKFKFPKVNIKSNEKVYRDIMDKKLTSLSMINNKVKEQLKSKNRYFTSQKEFYKFNNSYFSSKKNPLTETVKCLEDEDKENKK